MITLTSTPNGLRIARGADAYTAIGPAALAVIIARLLTSDPRPTRPAMLPASALPVSAPRCVSTPAGRSIGARLAMARQALIEGIR